MHIPGYQIERELGQGGMAIVYLAMQESLHRHVALKVIKPVLTTDEEFAQRFLREGRIIAQLSDPHIVTVYDIAAHEGTYYLSMEYLPGGTLQQRIRAGLPLPEALAIARAIVSALYYAHRRNIIHRDIKPQNILFRENGHPVLTDFGIAKTLGSSTIMTRTGLSIGTPRYMSPEQIRGQGVDARADLYSFGVLFYEMLTGNVPYTADDSFALAMMHVTAPLPQLPAQLSRFQPLLDKLLDKDPERRFPDGGAVIAALNAVETAPIDLLDITGARQAAITPPPPRRASWKLGTAAALLAGGALAGGYWYWSQQQAAPPPAPLVVAPPTVDPAAQQRAEAERLLARARQQQQAGALQDSLASVEQGLQQSADHAELLALRAELNAQIKASSAPQPQREPAAQTEQQLQAQLQIAQFLELAQRARQDGALDVSQAYIEQGLQVMPDHPELRALRQDVQRLQAERQRQAEAEQRRAELIARQQAEAEQRKAELIARQQAEAEQRKAEAERQKAEAADRQRRAEELLARALDAQRNRAYETSLLQIEQGLQLAGQNPRLLALREEVRRQLREAKTTPPPEPVAKPPVDEAAQIAALLRQCEAHLNAKRLTSGKGGNAADCYGEVLRRDRGNAQAQAGLETIAARYADMSRAALQRNDARAARSLIARIESLNPDDARLTALREQLARVENPPKPATPPPPPEPAERPVPIERPATPAVPPINLISVPQPSEKPATPETEVIAEDQHARLSRTQTKDNVSLQVTVSPQGLLDDSSRGTKSGGAKGGDAKEPAQLFVRANVEDAEIWINNRRAGTVPMQIEMRPGSYRVRVKREGYTDWNGKVDLSAGDESTITAFLPSREAAVASAPPSTRAAEPEAAPRTPEESPAAAPQPQVARASRQAPGCLSGNCENGQGSYRYPDGSEYSGQFRGAKMHGQGTYTYAGRGEKYSGEWRNGIIDGRGTYYYRSGNRYEGEWRSGRKSGQGTYVYAERGDKYVGDFANDQPNGQGTYYYSNGDRYEGEWRNGRKNGQGVLYENGRKIVGEWRNDQKVSVSVESE